MPKVTFGVSKALEPYKPDEGTNATKIRKLKGNRVVTFSLPPMVYLATGALDETGWTFEKWLGFVSSELPNRSDGAPDWVDSDDETLKRVLAMQHGCREGRPKNWKEGE